MGLYSTNDGEVTPEYTGNRRGNRPIMAMVSNVAVLWLSQTAILFFSQIFPLCGHGAPGAPRAPRHAWPRSHGGDADRGGDKTRPRLGIARGDAQGNAANYQTLVFNFARTWQPIYLNFHLDAHKATAVPGSFRGVPGGTFGDLKRYLAIAGFSRTREDACRSVAGQLPRLSTRRSP